jgi:hypothetical protein
MMKHGGPDDSDAEEEIEEGTGKCNLKKVEITPEIFEAHMRNVAFTSWDDLCAALAERPTAKGYISLHGESQTVVKLDPVRIFVWAAALFLNVCFWGLFSSAVATSPLLGLAVTSVGVGTLWWLLTSALSARFAGILWPNLPCMVGAAGFILACQFSCGNATLMSWQSSCENEELDMWLVLLLCILPHTLVAICFLRSLPSDPDRSSLMLNLFFGIWATVTWAPALVLDKTKWLENADWNWHLGMAVMLVEGLLALASATRLFFVPGTWGSVELVSWTLNLGALGVFVPCQVYFAFSDAAFSVAFVPLEAFLAISLAILATVLGRSFPFVLSACGCFIIVLKISQLFAFAAPVGPLLVFGLLGGAIIYCAQTRPDESSHVVERCRACLARLCGVRAPAPGGWGDQLGGSDGNRPSASPFFRDGAAGAPPTRLAPC